MTFDPNDPRLTAYVLGELEPSEHAEVEAILNESSECRRAVEEIRSTVGWLTERLHEEQAALSLVPRSRDQSQADRGHRGTSRRAAPALVEETRSIWPGCRRRVAPARCDDRLRLDQASRSGTAGSTSGSGHAFGPSWRV